MRMSSHATTMQHLRMGPWQSVRRWTAKLVTKEEAPRYIGGRPCLTDLLADQTCSNHRMWASSALYTQSEPAPDRRVNGRLDLQPSHRHSCGRFCAQTLDNVSS